MLSAIISVMVLAADVPWQQSESASCQSDIVSSTVVSTFCSHRQGDNLMIDLLILWRGKPGWFQGHSGGGAGGGGSRRFDAGSKGQVSEHKTYSDVTIGFDANFDTNVVTIGRSAVTLDHINTVIIDDVDGEWRISSTRWTEPRLPLVGDWNLALARRSNELLRYLRCDIPMPHTSPSYPVRQRPIVTVCERLKKQ